MVQDASQQQPARQFREPRNVYQEDRDALWGAIQANQREIAEAKLSTVQALGTLSSQVVSLQASMITTERLEKMLASKADRSEERTYRDWQADRYQLVSPAAQQAQRYSMNVNIQTICIVIALVFSALAAFGVHL